MSQERVLYEYQEIPWDEFKRRLELARAELDGPELSEIHSLIDWFTRRYPTPLERLRYARRKYDEWSRTRGILTNPR